MAESNKYVRIYTTYADGSYTGTDVFYKTQNPVKALEKFKEDFPLAPEITITAVSFDLGTVGRSGIKAFREAKNAGAVYEMDDSHGCDVPLTRGMPKKVVGI